MTKKRIIIIGAGNAGLSAYQVLAKHYELCQVTIISQELYLKYSPVADTPHLISDLVGLYPPYGLPIKPFLTEEIGSDLAAAPNNDDFLLNNQNQIILGKSVTQIDPDSKKVILDDGETLTYDALIICTGAKPVSAPIKSQEAGNVFGLNNQSDIENILSAAKECKNVSIIGAGIKGLEAALNLVNQGLNVSVIEKINQVLPDYFDLEAAEVIQSFLEENGLRLFLGTTVLAINQDEKGNVCSISLAGNKDIACDLVILALGVQSNIDVVNGSRIKVNRGILVNEKMETNCKDVYAAGDVVEAGDFIAGQRPACAILPDVVKQGKIAAMNALGLDGAELEGVLPVNVMGFNNNVLFSIGTTMKTDGYDFYTYASKEKRTYLKLVFEDDILIGAMGVNINLPVGIIRKLISDRVHLNNCKNILIRKPEVPDVWLSTSLAKLWRSN